jgi:acetyltransferase-like isoleucine patch superfamily enzyme
MLVWIKKRFKKVLEKNGLMLNRKNDSSLAKKSDVVPTDRLKELQSLQNAEISEYATLGKNSDFHIFGSCKKIKIGNGFNTRLFCNFLLYPDASLIINDNVFFNNYCSVSCLGRIEIGENTFFGESVKIYDHNHEYHYEADILHVSSNKFTIGHVSIGKNCWIGSNVTILKGVEIGENVIIGANCLIYKSIPANSIVKHKEDLIIESSKNEVKSYK